MGSELRASRSPSWSLGSAWPSSLRRGLSSAIATGPFRIARRNIRSLQAAGVGFELTDDLRRQRFSRREDREPRPCQRALPKLMQVLEGWPLWIGATGRSDRVLEGSFSGY